MTIDRAETPYRRGVEQSARVIVTTGNDVAGYRITGYLGVVRGIVVRSPSLGQGIVGAFKSLAGGNISEFTEVCEAARHEAYAQMVAHADELGANAVVGMRYDATEFAQGATEVLAYGTAVHLERLLTARRGPRSGPPQGQGPSSSLPDCVSAVAATRAKSASTRQTGKAGLSEMSTWWAS